VADPNRFQVSKATLRLDTFMTRFIFFGGLAVILAIFGIFFFILAEILPLFGGAKVTENRQIETGVSQPILLGADEWTELPVVADASGELTFVDLVGEREHQISTAPLAADAVITSAVYAQNSQTIAYGLSDGNYLLGTIQYRPRFAEDGSRIITASVDWDDPKPLGDISGKITGLDLFISETRKTIAGIIEGESATSVEVVSLVQKRSPFGFSGFSLDNKSDLSASIDGQAVQVLVGANAESVVVRTLDDTVHFFMWTGNQWDRRQSFSPFKESGAQIASMDYIQGKVSLNFTSTAGEHVVFSLYRSGEAGERIYGKTKDFDPFEKGATQYARSLRNKAFIIGDATNLSLRYSTTTKVRWETELETPLSHILIGEIRSISWCGLQWNSP
jgi:phosphate transport system permease protein